MVKQSPFQHDLFDFKSIEDQVKAIKKSVAENENKPNTQSSNEILHEQIALLENIQSLLMDIKNNTKKNWLGL